MFPYAPDFLIVLCASILLDIALTLSILLLPLHRDGAPRRITLGRCLIAAAVVALAWVPKVVLSRMLDVHLFGWMAMAYLTAAISAPAIGILALTIPSFRSRLTRGARVFACASLLAIPFAIYASYIEPSRIVFEESTVPVAGVKDPITIVVLADIQCSRITARERRIGEHVNALNPDLILIPGDLWQDRGSLGFEPLEDAVSAEFTEFLRSLRARHGVYFAPGNAEDGYGWRPVVEQAGVIALENQSARVTVGSTDIVIAGMEWRWPPPPAQNLVRALDTEPAALLTILMSHTPDVILDAYALGEGLSVVRPFPSIDLIISGHTHGGQVVVPGIGPVITFSRAPRSICAGGLHALDADTWIYVSRGVGMERGQAPRIRLFCPPEVSVITIKDPAAN